ncbi:MAG: hypothetical protein J7M05_13185 [Anaerolineae bacterium]|nr:hypothetical protein [Anaerolineae bacterium]
MVLLTPEIKDYFHELASRVAEIAADPAQDFRRRVWYAQNALQPIKPPVFISPEGSWVELIPPETLRMEDPLLRQWELKLRQRIYAWEHFSDDEVIDTTFEVAHVYTNTGWGVEATRHYSQEKRGSYVWDPPIKEYSDLDKMHYPEVLVDWEASQHHLELAQELVGDVLHVVQRTSFWWSLGLMNIWAQLRGLEQLMIDMVVAPQWMHQACQFLLEGQLHFLDNLEQQGLLSLNNGNHYIGSGAFGFTDELPSSDYSPGHVRTQDMWGFTEGQEITGVSPEMHWEFALQYEVAIHQRFGLTYYGCCEPLDKKFDYVKRLPHLRRVSVSPWCDRELAAQALEDKYVYAWKPHPAHLAAVHFDTDYIRQYIRETLEIARGCVVEIVLKDTHTCNHQPWRFDEWSRIAQEEAYRIAERD